ncbi:hydrogenase small subunit [Novipirellula herctigrandis]|uniref:hydrogenase small subunit n=1 Tax=Novipirellula herctigrandis TaxID=2527986 RepID=UPI003AF40057
MLQKNISRRDFTKLATALAGSLGLGAAAAPRTATALEKLAAGKPNVLWLQALSCSGCTVSALNSYQPDAIDLITEYMSLLFHSTISSATGSLASSVISETIDQGDFLLVVEGSIPLGMPEACMSGGRPISELIAKAAGRAKAVVAVGTCSSFGGIPAAENNPTGAVSVRDFLDSESIGKPLINLPGCPCHPDWLVGTLVHVTEFGMPSLDDDLRPTMFYSKVVHDQCPRFADYERGNFAESFSDSGCLFKLGCVGARTFSDCIHRRWNGGVNSCIDSGAPCIGCAGKDFAKKADFPLYRIGQEDALVTELAQR